VGKEVLEVVAQNNKMKKRVVFDALKLSNPYVGLGQVAMHLGQALSTIAATQQEIELCFLVPKSKHGIFGAGIKYITPKWWQRYLSWGYPKVDVWHALHQDIAFLPPNEADLILTIHDFNFMYEKSPKKAAKRLARVRRLIARSKQITTISNFVKEEVKQFTPEGYAKSVCIYNGVPDLTKYVTERKNPNDFIFTVANWTARKQLHVLLEVMKELPSMRLVVAGNVDTAYARPLVEQARVNGLKIEFVGKISDEEKAQYLQDCSAFVFPSRVEGFGLPIVEAMQFGKPIITTDGTCLPEVGGANCYYWTEGMSVREQADLINKAIDGSSAERREALKNRANEFSWELAAKEVWEKYTVMVNN
jgi:glycosyltransferase involved in cell wall biosynthesis